MQHRRASHKHNRASHEAQRSASGINEGLLQNHIIMKKIITVIAIVFIALSLNAQAPHPNGGDNPLDNGNARVPGGGAPVGGGLFVLLGLGAAYGLKKWGSK